jgi:ribonuclease D
MNSISPTSVLPSKEQIQTLPLFQNLRLENIHVIDSLAQCLALEQELKNCVLFGFDTESKPTFNKGQVSTGPHVIQLASANQAYLFQVNPQILEFLQPIFENKHQLKVGFGLKNDLPLFRKKGIQLNHILDLSKCFGSLGFSQTMGLKNAMALLFQVNFPKSKKISTSNWARKTLSLAQIQYAAADAYAPVLVFEELTRLGLLSHPSL